LCHLVPVDRSGAELITNCQEPTLEEVCSISAHSIQSGNRTIARARQRSVTWAGDLVITYRQTDATIVRRRRRQSA